MLIAYYVFYNWCRIISTIFLLHCYNLTNVVVHTEMKDQASLHISILCMACILRQPQDQSRAIIIYVETRDGN